MILARINHDYRENVKKHIRGGMFKGILYDWLNHTRHKFHSSINLDRVLFNQLISKDLKKGKNFNCLILCNFFGVKAAEFPDI